MNRVIGSAAADELARAFNRYFDFLTIASWTPDTPLGDGGLDLSIEERTACWRRCAGFFGVGDDVGEPEGAQRIGDWGAALTSAAGLGLKEFLFKAAARRAQGESHIQPADQIFQHAGAAANLLNGRRRLISFVAPHSVLGFILTVLTPNLQRISAIDARGETPEEIQTLLAYGDVVVATPTLWRFLMQENIQAPDNAMAVSFGEPMSPELAAQMRKAGFSVLRELYGSTEAGLVGWRDSTSEAFTLFDHWHHQDGNIIQVTPSGDRPVKEQMDFFEWVSDRHFHLAGRRDGAAQIGAVNVFPDDVAQRISEHPYIYRCSIRVGERRDGVKSLVAHVVLIDEKMPTDAVAREIDTWCREHLRHYERPRVYQFEAA